MLWLLLFLIWALIDAVGLWFYLKDVPLSPWGPGSHMAFLPGSSDSHRSSVGGSPVAMVGRLCVAGW